KSGRALPLTLGAHLRQRYVARQGIGRSSAPTNVGSHLLAPEDRPGSGISSSVLSFSRWAHFLIRGDVNRPLRAAWRAAGIVRKTGRSQGYPLTICASSHTKPHAVTIANAFASIRHDIFGEDAL